MSWSSRDGRAALPLPYRAAGAALLAAAAVTGGPAAAATRLEVEGRALASGNPLLLPGRERGAGLFELSLRPGATFATATGTRLDLDGVVTDRAYSRRYGNFVTGRIDARGTWRDSERLSIDVAAGFARDLAVDLLTSSVEASTDPRSLRTAYTASVSATWRPDAYNTLVPSAGIERYTFSRSTLLGATRSATVDLAYRRRVSPLTTIGIRAGSVFNRTQRLSDTSTQHAYATIGRRLSSNWRIDAEIGAERNAARVERVLGARVAQRARVLLSGRAELCWMSSGPRICGTASLNSEISGLGALQRRLAAGLSLTEPVGERTTLRADGEYQRAIMQGDLLPPFDAIRAGATIERRLAAPLTAGLRAQYARRRRIEGPRIGAAFVGIELRYRTGTPR